ncbi:hypothetical protein R5R35_009931 [Gryllus longicercus]
MKFSTMS